MPSQFFFQRNGKVVGPVSSDAIKKEIRSGRIRATDQIGRASDGPWKTIGDVPVLAKLFRQPTVAAAIDDLPGTDMPEEVSEEDLAEDKFKIDDELVLDAAGDPPLFGLAEDDHGEDEFVAGNAAPGSLSDWSTSMPVRSRVSRQPLKSYFATAIIAWIYRLSGAVYMLGVVAVFYFRFATDTTTITPASVGSFVGLFFIGVVILAISESLEMIRDIARSTQQTSHLLNKLADR